MANRLLKLRPVSTSNDTSEAGAGNAQKVVIQITGLQDGAGLAIDASDNVYVSDAARHVIYRWKRGAASSVVFAGQLDTPGNVDGRAGAARFNRPGPLAVDKRGNLWVVDVGNGRIRKVNDNGNVYTVSTIEIPAGGDVPGQIAVDNAEGIFVLDNN